MEALDRMPEAAVAALRASMGDDLLAVVLFGSRARGDATPESDWDLLVIARSLPERSFARHLFLKRLLPEGIRGSVSILARTPREFEARTASLYLDIALDGKMLYDPYGYASERFAQLRRLMERVGLYRQHTEAGDVWRWREEPHTPWSLEWSS